MYTIIKPKNYKALLSESKTEDAIQLIKEKLSEKLLLKLNLKKVTSPLIIEKGNGINDDLNGVERPVTFKIAKLDNVEVEIVQSLAKWKRMKLASLTFEPGKGLLTDMLALRPDETLSNVHSIFVDQWDWEKVIHTKDRNIHYLKDTVRSIYSSIKETEKILCHEFKELKSFLPDDIYFTHSEELLERYPKLTPKERENVICDEKKAVFVIGIGSKLKDGIPHDLRAPDYDDWSSASDLGKKGLNGDILVWNPILKKAFEISSMGIRVDKDTLMRQLKELDLTSRLKLTWHKALVEGKLLQTIGGGIGQSRIFMLLTQKAHIGEVQHTLWPSLMVDECKGAEIPIL